MSKQMTAILANGAESLVVGEITARTGLIANLAPRNNTNFDVIVNNLDITRGCRVEVKHSRSGFKANISGSGYDYLVFVYAPSDIVDGRIVPTADREVYVFPREVVETCPTGKTGKNFNPKHIENYAQYKDAFNLIAEAVE